MKLQYTIIILTVVACATVLYLLMINSPAERFGINGRLGSASTAQSDHKMISEDTNKMPRFKIPAQR